MNSIEDSKQYIQQAKGITCVRQQQGENGAKLLHHVVGLEASVLTLCSTHLVKETTRRDSDVLVLW